MKREKYSQELMVRYLLGSLPDEAAQEFDELCFVDDEFATRLFDIENDLVDAYVTGRLSGEELERFNSYYLASAKRRDKTRTARALQAFAERAVTTGQVAFSPGRRQYNSLPASIVLRRFLTFPRLALTVTALFALVWIGWMTLELSRLRSYVDQAQVTRTVLEQREKELQEKLERQRVVASEANKELERMRRQLTEPRSPTLLANLHVFPFTLPAPTRTASQAPIIAMPLRTDFLALQVELEPDDYPSYNAVLLSLPSKLPVGWRAEKVKSRPFGERIVIEVAIPASMLKTQDYLLSVSGTSGRGLTEGERGYPFRVVKQ